MPRGKKNTLPDSSGTTPRTRARRPVAEAVVAVGVEAGGVPVVPPGATALSTSLQTVVAQEHLTELSRQLSEITRQAQEARKSVQALRDEREQIGRELGELRQQVRAAQEQSLRETREGYAKVGHELNASTGRLGEAVAHAYQELTEVVRQAREARRELEELRRLNHEDRPDEPVPAARGRKRNATRPAAEHRNRLGVTVGNGVVVSEVLPDTPAATAGLTRGDVIEEVNGTGVVSATQLGSAVRKTADGEWVTLRVFRAGNTHELRAQVPAGEDADNGSDGKNRLGVTVGPGVVVAEVLPNTPAAAAGLVTGDVIDDLNGTAVQSGEELRDVVHRLKEDDVVLRVTRAGEVREVRTRLDNGRG